MKDRSVKVAKIIVVDKQPVRWTIPHLLAALDVQTKTSIARNGIDLPQKTVCRYKNACTSNGDFDVEVVIQHVHTVARDLFSLIGRALLGAGERGVCG